MSNARSPSTIVRRPVDLRQVDGAEAAAAAQRFGAVAASVIDAEPSVGSVRPLPVGKLCGVTAKSVNMGLTRQGMRLNGICGQAGVSVGHIRENFTQEWEDSCELAAREMFMVPDAPACYDLVFEQPARTREAKSLGAVGGVVRHLGIAVVNRHSCVPGRLLPLTTGTPHAASAPGADLDAINGFSAELGRPIPDGVDEHLALLLDGERRVKDIAVRSIKRFAPIGRDDRRHVEAAFPAFLVVPRISTGEPLPDRDVGNMYFPGDEMEACVVAKDSYRPCLLEMDPALLGEIGDDGGFARVTPTKLPHADQYGISQPGWGVEFRLRGHVLTRRVHDIDETGAPSIEVAAWRMINVEREQRLSAMAILEARARETWWQRCLDEFVRRTEPGLLQSPNARVRASMHGLLIVGNGANVYVDRGLHVRPRP